MEEEKAAAYYDELTRKGGGAARFKQGLGFSSSSTSENDAVPAKHTSFLSNFVRASSPTTASHPEKPSQLESIQNKLKKKPSEEKPTQSRVSTKDSDRERSHRDRGRDHRDRDRERSHRDRGRDHRDRDRDRGRSNRDRDGNREREYKDRERERGRRRSVSPPREGRGGKRREVEKERNSKVDYSRLIEGYDHMTPAERVKAKMKLQLAETANKDETKGSGWERFEFDKDAPLDDEEIEAAEDDAALVKHIGQSFRFSAIEARREEQIKAAHDEAMFGASAVPPSVSSDSEPEPDSSEKKSSDGDIATSLFSNNIKAICEMSLVPLLNGASFHYSAMKSKGKKQNQIHENYVITITCNASKQGLGFLLTSTALMVVPNDFGRGGTMEPDPSVDLLRCQFHIEHTMAGNRWIRPEVFPLFAAVGVAVGICGMQLVRNICINPEVRVTKQNRAAGVLENYAEGEKYSEHFLRKYVRNKTPEIMPKINSFFTDPQ
ncbi:serine/arginine-related protein 53 [Citrus sinensis]|uniref:Serine/arginine-related protein 53 n=1 Tax=Citrus sinensis TaxID=2711 RepID=A0ACB8LR21_CITSI|nr:serine/arginine-related protein 53 [Citrus sinensis]